VRDSAISRRHRQWLDAASNAARPPKQTTENAMDIGSATDLVTSLASLPTVLGLIGAAFHLASMSMRTVIPLRTTGIASAAFLLAAAILSRSVLAIVLYALLIPVHFFRLYQMLALIKKVRAAAGSDLSMDWLRPYMKRRSYRAGDVVFRKGDVANEMFLVGKGRYRVPELDIDLRPGEIFGELGLLTSGSRRTQSVECVETGHVMTLPYDEVRALYFENPEFGFYFLELSSGRLLQGLARADEMLAAQHRAHQTDKAAAEPVIGSR
jgi:CRP-like cAMP-binding protein